ncbi:GxxExxY protein [Aeoliella sp. ICT_H6.2]|uniref:GxxExxY protein n=1 Tax=Aeoliella straminimaris TaxID=2954799 RepID=A0A9X2JKH0_9BACT|nr:GxxExxY protein [Aeoliella straminimaris]MCO6046514.1 GxxExxY protein [Aeoliella straminimaris]
MTSADWDHGELTERFIGSAYAVYNELGFGFLESVYEKSLALWLLEHGLEARMQVPVDVFFRGQQVGEFRADLLVNDTVIVEIKSARSLQEVHEVQLVNYLVATRNRSVC